jgi:hypothetical protein
MLERPLDTLCHALPPRAREDSKEMNAAAKNNGVRNLGCNQNTFFQSRNRRQALNLCPSCGERPFRIDETIENRVGRFLLAVELGFGRFKVFWGEHARLASLLISGTGNFLFIELLQGSPEDSSNQNQFVIHQTSFAQFDAVQTGKIDIPSDEL